MLYMNKIILVPKKKSMDNSNLSEKMKKEGLLIGVVILY